MVPAVLALAVVALLFAWPAHAMDPHAADPGAVEKSAQDRSSKPTVPETQGRAQPQGPSGPVDTKPSGGAPARSPQGETPPGMQSAPEGSSTATKEPPN